MEIKDTKSTKIYLSALAKGLIPKDNSSQLIAALNKKVGTNAIAQSFGSPKLVRQLRLKQVGKIEELPKITLDKNKVIFQDKEIGKIKILYKAPLPGELQARLSYESAIDRFLEYLQKCHKIVLLDESDYHVQVFIPGNSQLVEFNKYWYDFLKNVAFSIYGDTKYQLPGLAQTFIVMLNSVTLAGRGFSTLEVPVLTKNQSDVLAAWYLAVVREVEKRQFNRHKQIDYLQKQLENSELKEKERKSKEKKMQDLQEMQDKEAKKYTDYFQKSFRKVLNEQKIIWEDLTTIKSQLEDSGLKKAQINKLQKQEDKLKSQIIFNQNSIQNKFNLLEQCHGNPFEFIFIDKKQNSEILRNINQISKLFTKTATDQINSTRGDIFTQCILEMYRLLENPPNDPKPQELLSEQPRIMENRSPGDDSREFCYSCGITLDSKKTKWKVARFMFERPSQRRQSSSSEDRPQICASCSALAFASPLKLTDESIIIKLKSANSETEADRLKLKDYIRMLTNKEMHLSAGRYVVLASDKTSSGDAASQKLGQIQYALAKIASIFATEVLTDFKFNLVTQGSQEISLASRHLVFIKGLMECYGQSIIVSGKEINMKLGDAIRYVEQDLPFLADYTLVKASNISKPPEIENARLNYWRTLKQDLKSQGVHMSSGIQLSKRAKLYEDVAALTGLTYPFVNYAEKIVKEHKEKEAEKNENKVNPETIKKEVAREISKIIENVHNLHNFCYFASIGDEKRESITANLYRDRKNHFIYDCVKSLLKNKLSISELKEENSNSQLYLTLEIGDLEQAYKYFAAEKEYADDKGWNELTYNLKLSLYTRFPELVRKLKSKGDK